MKRYGLFGVSEVEGMPWALADRYGIRLQVKESVRYQCALSCQGALLKDVY